MLRYDFGKWGCQSLRVFGGNLRFGGSMAEAHILDLRKSYVAAQVGHGAKVDIAVGQFVARDGLSRCSKSIPLRMTVTLEDLTSGTVRTGDRVVNNLPLAHRHIAVVFQNYALYPHKTMAANMGFALGMAWMDKAEVASVFKRTADILSLKPYLACYPRGRSGFRRRPVAIATPSKFAT